MSTFGGSGFRRLMIAEALFMAGYIVIKVGLSLVLTRNHFSLMDAYSISTTAAVVFSISNLLLGMLSPFLGEHKQLMLVGVFLAGLGFSCFYLLDSTFVILSLTLFVVGSALYCINIKLFINDCFENQKRRHQANNIYHVALNAGAVFGIVLLIFVIRDKDILFSLIGSVCFILTLFALLSKKITTHQTPKKLTLWWLKKTSVILLFCLVCYVMMVLREYTRYFTLLVFFFSLMYIVKDCITTSSIKHIKFLTLLFLCAFTYWLAIAIYYNQFSIFLNNHVKAQILGLSISPLVALMVDPIVNVLFGTGLIKLYSKKALNVNFMLIIGLLSIFLAFFILGNVHHFYSAHDKIPLYWVFISIGLIAIGEFLIFPTLQTEVYDLSVNTSKQGFYMGLIQFVSAVAAVCAYYLIKLSHTISLSNQLVPDDSYRLYTYVYCIFGCSAMVLIVLQHFGWLINDTRK